MEGERRNGEGDRKDDGDGCELCLECGKGDRKNGLEGSCLLFGRTRNLFGGGPLRCPRKRGIGEGLLVFDSVIVVLDAFFFTYKVIMVYTRRVEEKRERDMGGG